MKFQSDWLEKSFIISMTCVIITSFMLWTGRIDAEAFREILIWVTGLFITGKASGEALQRLWVEPKIQSKKSLIS